MKPDPQERWLSAVLAAPDPHKPFEAALSDGLSREHFTGHAGEMFAVLVGLYSERAPFTVPVLVTKCDGIAGVLGEGGLLARVCGSNAEIATTEGYWRRQVRRTAMHRALQKTLRGLDAIGEDDEHVEAKIAKAQAALLALTASRGSSEVNIHAEGDAIIRGWRDGERLRLGVTWPLPTMNEKIGPIVDELILLAAMPSLGKTALSLQLALMASKQHVVSFLSLESTAQKAIQRLIAQVTQCATLPMMHGRATAERFAEALEKWKAITSHKLRLRSGPHTVDQVRAWASAEKAQGSRLLILDNLKHVRTSQKFNSIPEQFRALSDSMKRIRDDVQLPLLVIHHMTEDEKISWSRDIERDFDLILSMTHDTKASGQDLHRVVVDVTVLKNREGYRDFTVKCNFEKDIQTFFERGHHAND